jgi:hypothetical protein
MNSKAFLALFFNAVSWAAVHGIGSFTTVAYQGALTIPLLAATSGTFGTAIAVLGVLKLGAAALLLASSLGGEEEEGYGYKRRFARHAEIAPVSTDKDALFALIRSMDTLECGKALICELEAQEEIQEDEALILTLFSDRKNKNKTVNPGSAKAEYDLAAELGLASKNEVICRQRYASCPYTAKEMMEALRNSHL